MGLNGQQVGTQASTTPPTAVKPLHPATASFVRPGYGAHKGVAPENRYFRITVVVPLVGTGKRFDPIRPDFVPVHKPGDKYRSGIIAYTQIPTDDGKHAIVEMVATSPSAFAAIRADKRTDVVILDRDKDTPAHAEAAAQQFRRDFSFAKFPKAAAQ